MSRPAAQPANLLPSRIGPPPHAHSRSSLLPITLTFLIAAAFPLTAGMALFGLTAAKVLALSCVAAMLVESLYNLLVVRDRIRPSSSALLVGALVACTLPPDVPWQTPVLAAATAMLIGHALSGGIGNYLWHPVVLGRIAVQLFYPPAAPDGRLPVLARGHLLWGDLTNAAVLPSLRTWAESVPPDGAEAWRVVPSIVSLTEPIPGRIDEPVAALARLLRDAVPTWWETLAGVAGGAIGEASAGALILAGLFLAWRGLLRPWPVCIGVLCAGLTVAFLPVQVRSESGESVLLWCPGTVMWKDLPVGLVYILYHLTAGEFLLVMLLLAPETTTSPLTSRGHMLYYVCLAIAMMCLRVLVGIPAAGYWALLIANTFVPLINAITRRRVLGT